MALPAAYAWLANEPGPRMILEALKLYGTLETPGPESNPEILSWADELKVSPIFPDDQVPWCGLFMGIVAHRAGKTPPKQFFRALNWQNFGKFAPIPMLGDVLVFRRDGGAHVALYVGEDETAFHMLGGNQSDRVSIARKNKGLLLCARRPSYFGQPKNVRRIFLDATGELSTNEA